MKIQITLTLMLACFIIRAQNLKSYTVEVWNGSGWDTSSRFSNMYNSSFNRTGDLYETYNITWQNNQKGTTFLDAVGNATMTLNEQWNGSAWANSMRTFETFSLNLPSTSTLQAWSGSVWTNQSKYTRTYDSQGNTTSYLSQVWNGLTWDNNSLTTYLNDTILTQNWTSNQWVNSNRQISTYSLGLLIETLAQNYSGSWQNSNRTQFTHNSNQKLIYTLDQYWGGTGWINAMNTTFNNDVRGTPTLAIGQMWTSSNTWSNNIRIGMDYIIMPPFVKTLTISAISESSARCEATVLFDGGADILTTGFCFDTQSGPTISDLAVYAFATTGSFVVDVNSLLPSTTYFVRAFATNTVGIRYGNELQFTTAQLNALLENTSSGRISIYPNPADNILSVQSPESTTVEILEITGKVLQTRKCDAGENNLDITDLPAGLYTIKFSGGQATRLIKK